jgi:hypothetical protein
MMNGAKFLQCLHHWRPNAHPRTVLPVELESIEDFAEATKILNNIDSFSIHDFKDSQAILPLDLFGSGWKSGAFTDYFKEYLSLDLANILLGTLNRYSFKIIGDLVNRFVNEIDMIGVQLRDIDKSSLTSFNADHLVHMADLFTKAARTMRAGIAAGYGDCVVVYCG